jgi:hypothetical protein
MPVKAADGQSAQNHVISLENFSDQAAPESARARNGGERN